MVIGTLDRRLVWVSKLYSGRTHDFAIFKELFAGINLKNYRVHVDAGFVGIKKFSECGFVFIPFKARKNYPLTSFQRLANQALAHFRVAIENTIAKMKSFFILRTKNRMRKKEKLTDAVSLCAEIVSFKAGYSSY